MVPAGSTQTGGLGGYTVSATSGSNSIGNNFDNFTNISISGTKFNDITGNSFSGDDVGQGGVTINLYLNGGSTPVASTVTAADGSYSFTNLGPGSYSVQEVVPAGSTQTGGKGGYTFSATSGSNLQCNNFDNFANISYQRHQIHRHHWRWFLRRRHAAGWRDHQSIPKWQRSNRFYCHRGRRFVQLHQSRTRNVLRAGSSSRRLHANGRNAGGRLHFHGPQRAERRQFQFRRLPKHFDQRHEVQRHHRQWL